MAKQQKGKGKPTEVQVMHVDLGVADFYVLGTSPLIMNRMSEKAKHELLLPHIRLNRVERETRLKHDPIAEFHAAPYHTRNGEDAYLAMPSAAFKGVMKTAALDLPGTNKAQIGRLTFVPGEYTAIYGLPFLHMGVVRMADIGRTPDIRTRVIVPEWCAHFQVHYAEPLLSVNSVSNLIAAGGIFVGVGDGRQEKGTLSFGQFRIVKKDNADFRRIMKLGGRKAQQDGMKAAQPYDEEAARMLAWYAEELKARNFKKAENEDEKRTRRQIGEPVAPKTDGKADGAGEGVAA